MLGILVWWLYPTMNKSTPPALPLQLPPVSSKKTVQEPVSQTSTTNETLEPENNWEWTNHVPVEQRAFMIDRIKKLTAIASAVNVPIVFYGKVIDQNNQPVEGVRVAAFYNRWSVSGLVEQRPGRMTNYFSSDGKGQFEVKGIRGSSMTIQLEKEGYELAPHSRMSFAFDPGALERYVPDLANPVVYHMWKRLGAAELEGLSFESMIPSDGQSIWIAEKSDKGSRAELPDAILKLTVNRERRMVTFADKSPYKWNFEIDMLGGGIQKTDDLFLYQAPETGYNPILTVLHEASDPNWIREQTFIFYFKTNKNKYGRGEIFVSNWENESEVYCRMSITWNPDGSRNLEPKPE